MLSIAQKGQKGVHLWLQEPERSSGSQEKLLRKESGLGKWGSMGTKEKFNAADLMAEVIENSEQVGF